jgi:hypothetical protein
LRQLVTATLPQSRKQLLTCGGSRELHDLLHIGCIISIG